MQTSKDVLAAIKQICDEKEIPQEPVIETIEMALAAAYRKDFGKKNQNIKAEFDKSTAEFRVFDVKKVVEAPPEETEEAEVKEITKEALNKETLDEEKKFNPKTDLTLEEARAIKPDAELGEEIKTELEVPANFGRMAAQTAKQVIIQRIREVERDTVYNEFKSKENEMITGVVQRIEGRLVLIDLGRVTGILPPQEQIMGEYYNPAQRLKLIILAVNQSPKGPEIILSRAHPEMVKKMFSLEVPEIGTGAVEIVSVAREAGSRSKVAVKANDENFDPVGSCVGQRGSRVQTVISELGGEKIDIVLWDEDPEKFIASALSPAKIQRVEIIDKNNKEARVYVKQDQQYLEIGKRGKNVRLAARLTGCRIDIVEEETEKVVGGSEQKEEVAVVKEETEDAEIKH
jgi:N utilization substance protein A